MLQAHFRHISGFQRLHNPNSVIPANSIWVYPSPCRFVICRLTSHRTATTDRGVGSVCLRPVDEQTYTAFKYLRGLASYDCSNIAAVCRSDFDPSLFLQIQDGTANLRWIDTYPQDTFRRIHRSIQTPRTPTVPTSTPRITSSHWKHARPSSLISGRPSSIHR